MLKINKTKMEIKSFPTKIFGLALSFTMIGLYSFFFIENDLKLIDGFIFFGVCLIALIIHKHKTIIINKKENSLTLITKSILKTKIDIIKINEIENIEISYGRGQYASGGCIILTTDNDEKFIIMDSDIGKVKRINSAKVQIEEFIFN